MTPVQARFKHERSAPIPASLAKSPPKTPGAYTLHALAEIMTVWATSQRTVEEKLQTTLTMDQETFLEKGKFGCVFPPASQLLPEITTVKFPLLTKSDLKDVSGCLDILKATSYSWSKQHSSQQKQHHAGIATVLLQLHQNKELIITNLLGERSIWELYLSSLQLIHVFAPSFLPWHGITNPDHRSDNAEQVLLEFSLGGEDIQPIVGAGMASNAFEVDERYRAGLIKAQKSIIDMASHTHDGQKYISHDVDQAMKALFRVSMFDIHEFYEYFRHNTDNFYIDSCQRVRQSGLPIRSYQRAHPFGAYSR